VARRRRAGAENARSFAEIEARIFTRPVFRFIGSRFLASPLSSAGSRGHGGRFNPPDTFEALYTALSADTALAEREGFLLTAGAIKAARSVRTAVLVRIDCRLERVLDLTDTEVRRRLGITLAELLGPWRPWNVRREPGAAVTLAPTQLLGRRVHESRRFEAILAPSARDSAGQCLAVFPGRLGPRSSLTIDDPEGFVRGALGLGATQRG